MQTQIFKRTNGTNVKYIEVYDVSGNFYKSFEYIENERGAINQAKEFCRILEDFEENKREFISTRLSDSSNNIQIIK